MKPMKMFLTYFLIFLAAILFYSCNPDYLENSYYLTEEEKEYIPFKGDEKVNFITSDSDQIVFSATPPVVEIIETPSGVNTKKYYEYETLEINLVSNHIIITYFLSANDKRYHYKPFFNVSWVNDIDGTPGVKGGDRVPFDTSDFHSRVVLLDSVSVLDKVYYEVFKGNLEAFMINDSVYEPPVYPTSYYYKLHYGIIRFDFSDSTSWNLENIVQN
ncbi:MAG: hypothetical protein KQH67_02690 [Bacteroidetes bacterium]|nr:hypothetical protein [Bacteroidota bacterium]